MRSAGWIAIAFVAAGCATGAAEADRIAQCEQRFQEPCLVAGSQYGAIPPHQWIFGAGYRELWVEPVPAPPLDLEHTADGLVPVRVVGHMQSRNLALRGGDGRAYTFRGIDKDPSKLLPRPIRWVPPTPQLFRDQTASNHPGAPLVARALARAAGTLEPESRLVFMPDDARLGEFREQFAGVLGTFEEYPTAASAGHEGTFGATEILDTPELADVLEGEGLHALDARSYLRARLVDLVLGDPDRHPGQWRWARIPDRGRRLVPLPEDRDLAFVRYGGAALAVARPFVPLLSHFDDEFDVGPLAHQSRILDRRLLAELEVADWEAEVRAVQEGMSLETIRAAIARLPDPWREESGEALEAHLTARLAALPRAAAELRSRLAHELDVHATGDAEVFSVRRRGDAVVVAVRESGPSGRVSFEREVDPAETERIRLCGLDEDDRVEPGADRVPVEVDRAERCPESTLRFD